MYARDGIRKCMRKGCRGPEMAAFAVDMWLDRIARFENPRLNELIAKMPSAERAHIMAAIQGLREWLYEEFEAKFAMWKHLPYHLLGLGHSDKVLATACCKACLNEWDSTPAAQRDKVHRVARRFFCDDKIKKQMEDFASGDDNLSAYTELETLVAEYSLVPLVERAIEGEHAKIEKALKLGIPTPAGVCARLRSPYLLTMLDNKMFYAWCKGLFASHVFRKLLKNVCTPQDMKKWTRQQYLQRIYMYGVTEQYEDVKDINDCVRAWQAAVSRVLQPLPPSTPPTQQLALEWLKARFVAGRLFALPAHLLRLVNYVGYAPLDIRPSRLDEVLPLFGCDDVLRENFDVENMTFFRVVHSNPNRRILQHPWHLGCRPRVIKIAAYDVKATTDGTIVVVASAVVQCLDLAYLSSSYFSEVVQSLWTFGREENGTSLSLTPASMKRISRIGIQAGALLEDQEVDLAQLENGEGEGDASLVPQAQESHQLLSFSSKRAYDLVGELLHHDAIVEFDNFVEVASFCHDQM